MKINTGSNPTNLSSDDATKALAQASDRKAAQAASDTAFNQGRDDSALLDAGYKSRGDGTFDGPSGQK